MHSIRFTLVLIIFFTMSFWILAFSYRVGSSANKKSTTIFNAPKADSLSVFEKVDYFVTDNNVPSVYLKADSLKSNNTDKQTAFVNPNGKVFNKKQVPTYYKALKGFLDQKEGYFSFSGDVKLDHQKSTLTSDEAHYLVNQERFNARGNVKSQTENEKNGDKMFIDSQQAFFWPNKKISIYKGNVEGIIKRKKVYEPNIYFWTDKLKADLNESVATLNGNVRLKKQELTAQSLNGEIFLENYNKKLKYYALYDDVRLVEIVDKDGELITRKAFGEKLEVFNLEKKSILSGAPKVYQGSDLIRGNVITLREGTEIIEVDDSSSVISIKGEGQK